MKGRHLGFVGRDDGNAFKAHVLAKVHLTIKSIIISVSVKIKPRIVMT